MVPEMSLMGESLVAYVAHVSGRLAALVLEVLRPRPVVPEPGVASLANEKVSHLIVFV